MAILGPGSPLRIGQEFIWQGRNKSNGFLMRNSDGRIPALKESMSRIDIPGASVLYQDGVIPHGNGLFRDMTQLAAGPGVVSAAGGTGFALVGIIEFNQGWQTGHPVQGWGIPQYGRTDMIRSGLVGYKVTKALGASAADYLAYLKGDRSKDVPAIRLFYDDWIASLAGTNLVLSLAFEVATGFPVMVAWNGTNWTAAATLVKAGDIVITENENKAVFVQIEAKLGGAR